MKKHLNVSSNLYKECPQNTYKIIIIHTPSSEPRVVSTAFQALRTLSLSCTHYQLYCTSKDNALHSANSSFLYLPFSSHLSALYTLTHLTDFKKFRIYVSVKNCNSNIEIFFTRTCFSIKQKISF